MGTQLAETCTEVEINIRRSSADQLASFERDYTVMRVQQNGNENWKKKKKKNP
jgi:ribosomal protein S24E